MSASAAEAANAASTPIAEPTTASRATLGAFAARIGLSAAASPNLVKRGEYLARAGDCSACHTADKSRPFAGGVPISTPFGTIYTPNITPDPETGIGRWDNTDFLRAMHEGIGKRGERLYPAFPYTEYTKVTQQDVLAIRAYLNTVMPVRYTPPASTLTFPFNQRWLMVFWNLFNFDEGRFVPEPKNSAEWNRGAYLVQGLGHCEECHTPRNFTQGLKSSARFSGATLAGWHAFNITPDRNSGIGNWSEDDLMRYLSTGVAPGRANAAGPMAEVVAGSTQYLDSVDLRSIAIYLRSLPPVSGGETRPRDQWGQPADAVSGLRGQAVTGINGAQLFLANCASCHNWTGQGVGASAPLAYPSLMHNTVVGASQANNLALVVLNGVARKTQQTDVLMPAFGAQLNNEQIAALTNYVTKQFGNPQATITADQVQALRAH
ncbi:cytochrome c [Paraburkholderia bonniea]|uniref:c-type cytochrome n=1 Tax=Paraburkholderia bonniea TaxID=2152891 RepID=UPI00129278AF|nr:cytochrome c [Paraburkholderia bonniea]WJF92165.1 cytochrome c [Paraburkholderia bonniea]WJF95485.1 cytochrome c [Paraburkholderia bonniea]